MSVINKIKKPIEEELKRFEPYFKNIMHSQSRLLNFVINYSLKTKGKQMRPMLVFLTCKLTGKISDSTMTAAALIELLHTATLIHDDVVDESFYRRGFFSIFALWKAKIAVLTGDYFLAQGLLLSLKNNETEILRIVSDAVREMSEGELQQLEKANMMNITEEDYYVIIRKKTGALISACCQAGAYSSGASEEDVDRMKKFGELIGTAFQIKDDLFDYQETGLIGKPKYNDIQERKLTLPVIYSLNKANIVLRKKIMRLLRKRSKSNQDITQIVDFVKNSGGVEYANNKMYEFHNQAVALLEKYPDTEEKEALILLCKYIVERNK
ncbi:MAG: polyprenyl synthetase family protein [Bacteroidales bacterium]|jgi:octaprenyl-diphosphate synthase|nr:polyprenyl synthetase family protein [Bacteroidales bacterium]MBR6279648.1 polyprenyl synthetase family protein [Bacteroidales bacterium]